MDEHNLCFREFKIVAMPQFEPNTSSWFFIIAGEN